MRFAIASALGVIVGAALVWALMPGPREPADDAEAPQIEAAPSQTPAPPPAPAPRPPPVAAPTPPPPVAPPVAQKAPEPPPEPPAQPEPPPPDEVTGPLGQRSDYVEANEFLEQARSDLDHEMSRELAQWRISEQQGEAATRAILSAADNAKEATMRMLDGGIDTQEWLGRLEKVDEDLKKAIARDVGEQHLPGLAKLRTTVLRTTPETLRKLYTNRGETR